MRNRDTRWWLVGLAIAALVVVVLAPLASPDPDGLERVGENVGFLDAARDALYSILPDYTVPGIDDEYWSLISAGVIGVAIVFIVTVLFGLIIRRTNKARSP